VRLYPARNATPSRQRERLRARLPAVEGEGIHFLISAPPRRGLAAVGATLLLFTAPARPALAHGGPPPAPADLWAAWSWEPSVLLALALATWAYARGLRALWRSAGLGRGVRTWQAAAYAGGLLTVFVALISPLDALSSALFSAHMVQHLLLMLVAGPVLILGAPLAPLLWALPEASRRALGGWWKRAGPLRAVWCAVSRPLVVWTLQAIALWAWHLPGPYQAALQNDLVHAAEHASFLITALLFWWTLAHSGGRGVLGYGAGIVYGFTTGVQSSVLGALITFAPQPWYPAYAESAAVWGLTPLRDQELAGLIMWVPAGTVYLLAALALFALWLRAEDREASQVQGVAQ
jgi:putative membrane protein